MRSFDRSHEKSIGACKIWIRGFLNQIGVCIYGYAQSQLIINYLYPLLTDVKYQAIGRPDQWLPGGQRPVSAIVLQGQVGLQELFRPVLAGKCQAPALILTILFVVVHSATVAVRQGVDTPGPQWPEEALPIEGAKAGRRRPLPRSIR